MTDRRPASRPPALRRMVLLLHEPDAGMSHFDWMFERASEDDRRLVTFRVADRVDLVDRGDVRGAERLADHRARYLEYEGEIAGGRVTRVARGIVHGFSIEDQRLEGVVSWCEPNLSDRLRLEGETEASGQWRIRWEVEARAR